MEQAAMTPAELLEVMSRRKLSLVVPAALVFLLGVAVALFWPPVYKSTATILIEEQEVPTDFVMTTVTSFAEQRIQQINQRIMSFSRLLEVIQQYGLYPELKESRTTEEIVEKMREDTALQPVSAEVIDRRTGRPTAATIAFTLSYQGRNPRRSSRWPTFWSRSSSGEPEGEGQAGRGNFGFSGERIGQAPGGARGPGVAAGRL